MSVGSQKLGWAKGSASSQNMPDVWSATSQNITLDTAFTISCLSVADAQQIQQLALVINYQVS
jgi:hypothetical protein